MATSTVPEPTIHSIFEDRTGTWQYVVADPVTKKAALIDAVLDFDAGSKTISTVTADNLLATISHHGYQVDKILETHAHADHLTAASYLQYRLEQIQGFRPPICIGKRIEEVQRRFAAKYSIPADEYEGVFDRLLDDDEEFALGQLTVRVMHLPGHTPDHIGYQIASKSACGKYLQQVLMSKQKTCFVATRYSTPTLAPRAATFRAAAQEPCIRRRRDC